MAAPTLLCLAPLENGKFCQLKKRPCHFHGAYWAAQEEAGGEENDSEGSNSGDSDTDSVSSIATNSIDSKLRCGAETGKGAACKQPGRPCHLHKLWWKTHKVPFTSPKHAAKPSSSSTGWYVQEEVAEWTEVGDSPVAGSGAVAALSPASSSGSGSPSPSDAPTYMHSSEMRTTGQRLYNEHFSQPYTDKKTCSHDWQLEVPGGTVQRPNHGFTGASWDHMGWRPPALPCHAASGPSLLQSVNGMLR